MVFFITYIVLLHCTLAVDLLVEGNEELTDLLEHGENEQFWQKRLFYNVPSFKMLKRQMIYSSTGFIQSIHLVFRSTKRISVRWFRNESQGRLTHSEVPGKVPLEGDPNYKLTLLRSGEVWAAKLDFLGISNSRDFVALFSSNDGSTHYQLTTKVDSKSHGNYPIQVDLIQSADWLISPPNDVTFKSGSKMFLYCAVHVPKENGGFADELELLKATNDPFQLLHRSHQRSPIKLEFISAINYHKDTTPRTESSGDVILVGKKFKIPAETNATVYYVGVHVLNAGQSDAGKYLCRFERRYDTLVHLSHVREEAPRHGKQQTIPRFDWSRESDSRDNNSKKRGGAKNKHGNSRKKFKKPNGTLQQLSNISQQQQQHSQQQQQQRQHLQQQQQQQQHSQHQHKHDYQQIETFDNQQKRHIQAQNTYPYVVNRHVNNYNNIHSSINNNNHNNNNHNNHNHNKNNHNINTNDDTIITELISCDFGLVTNGRVRLVRNQPTCLRCRALGSTRGQLEVSIFKDDVDLYEIYSPPTMMMMKMKMEFGMNVSESRHKMKRSSFNGDDDDDEDNNNYNNNKYNNNNNNNISSNNNNKEPKIIHRHKRENDIMKKLNKHHNDPIYDDEDDDGMEDGKTPKVDRLNLCVTNNNQQHQFYSFIKQKQQLKNNKCVGVSKFINVLDGGVSEMTLTLHRPSPYALVQGHGYSCRAWNGRRRGRVDFSVEF